MRWRTCQAHLASCGGLQPTATSRSSLAGVTPVHAASPVSPAWKSSEASTVPSYPFQVGFTAALFLSTLGAALAGIVLGTPTLRLRGDYLAIVTLGFGEMVRFTLRNLEEITAGTRPPV